MSRAYSIDLRERVVAAVETGGLSCHRAAAQFGVGISTAIRWVEQQRNHWRAARAFTKSECANYFANSGYVPQ